MHYSKGRRLIRADSRLFLQIFSTSRSRHQHRNHKLPNLFRKFESLRRDPRYNTKKSLAFRSKNSSLERKEKNRA